MVKPIFVFCLVRSGSTLLQRILMSHSKISSTAEPHFLLPLIYANRKEGTLASYSHMAAQQGVEDTINSLPGGQGEFDSYIKDFSLKIYNSLSEEESEYFLDKTPRYFSIIEDIERIFPKAKFIFLFRNPVQIYASVLETFGSKRFKGIQSFYGNLTKGFELLSKSRQNMKAKSISINYESLVKNPKENIHNLLNYLDLGYEEKLTSLYSRQKLEGKSKDPTGIKKYSTIQTISMEKWKIIFNTNFRKRILTNYVKSLSHESLEIQGYEKQKILKEIKQIDTRGKYNFFTDAIDLIQLKMIINFKLNILFASNMDWNKGEYLN